MNGSPRKTKIIATLGPATNSAKMIERLVKAGINLFRINGSHASGDEIGRYTNMIRSIAKKLDIPVGVLLDLQGPKIRVGEFENGSMKLLGKARILLKVTDRKSGGDFIPVAYRGFHKDVKPGSRILLSDGRFELKVVSVSGKNVTATVVHGGILNDKQGINLPDTSISASPITRKDKENLKAGLSANVDFVAMSFVKDHGDIRKLRALIRKENADTGIIAKIERHEAVDNMEAIIAEADGVMVARGDLGVEMGVADVPLIQLKILRYAQTKYKPAIVATQMLESMILNPNPTRAEISDISNAVQSYADAIMLSGETAVGKYPVECVKYMVRTAKAVEEYQENSKRNRTLIRPEGKNLTVNMAIGYTAGNLASILGAKAIIAMTESGSTAKRVSSHRPVVPIYAFSPLENTYYRLSLVRGVTPFMASVERSEHWRSFPEIFDKLKRRGLVAKGDRVVITAGSKMSFTGGTNIIRVEIVK